MSVHCIVYSLPYKNKQTHVCTNPKKQSQTLIKDFPLNLQNFFLQRLTFFSNHLTRKRNVLNTPFTFFFFFPIT